MNDITLCTNHECPISSRCERRTAIPGMNQYSQRFEFTQDETGIKCDKFRMFDDMCFTNHHLINLDNVS